MYSDNITSIHEKKPANEKNAQWWIIRYFQYVVIININSDFKGLSLNLNDSMTETSCFDFDLFILWSKRGNWQVDV